MGPMSLKLFYILLRCSLSPKHDSLMKSNWSHTLLSNNMVPLLTVLVSPKRLISWHHVSYTEERQAGNNHHKKCNYSNLAGFFFDTSNTITINDTHGSENWVPKNMMFWWTLYYFAVSLLHFQTDPHHRFMGYFPMLATPSAYIFNIVKYYPLGETRV